MADLIDRETAKRELLNKATIINDRRFMKTDSAIAVLDLIPAAPVRPDRRGKWKPSLKFPGYYECSACADCFIDPDWLEKGKWHFCPHCGADLRSDEERTAANEK